ncbi:MAG: trypsin-like peptidase domain-containing protein [Anaerolineaceae bacterium]|nr:trypsin-like peptidase domain-containing protein [Anaerolineaceae bacterium]
MRDFISRTKKFLPFASGVAASLLALLLYHAIFPGPQPLTVQEVNETVAQVMASATPLPAYSARVYQAIQPSLVLIQAWGADQGGESNGRLGSGVVVTDQGDILTSLHVVKDAAGIQVTFADGTQANAQITVEQPENDIALLSPDRLPQVLVPAVLGNPNSMHIGDEAYAVGNPFGLYGSMSAGVVSGFNRAFHSPESDQRLEGLIQFDTAVNPGNSGGPLLNRDGHVVGIVVGILNPVEEDFFVGIGFAVPITIAGGGGGSLPY